MKVPENRMKIQKLNLKMKKTLFENAKTQFTGDLLAWTGRAMRSKKTPEQYPLRYSFPSTLYTTFRVLYSPLYQAAMQAYLLSTIEEKSWAQMNKNTLFLV